MSATNDTGNHADGPSLPSDKAFVVQFRAQADGTQEHCEGRVEHLVSGRATRFSSQAELMAFFVRNLLKQES